MAIAAGRRLHHARGDGEVLSRYAGFRTSDHATGSTTETSYDQSKRLERRREIVTWHEAGLIAARDGATVLPLERDAVRFA
jgi:hypothetical protein